MFLISVRLANWELARDAEVHVETSQIKWTHSKLLLNLGLPWLDIEFT